MRYTNQGFSRRTYFRYFEETEALLIGGEAEPLTFWAGAAQAPAFSLPAFFSSLLSIASVRSYSISAFPLARCVVRS